MQHMEEERGKNKKTKAKRIKKEVSHGESLSRRGVKLAFERMNNISVSNKNGSSPNITRELNQKHLLSRSRRAWEISLWAPVSPSIESPEFFSEKETLQLSNFQKTKNILEFEETFYLHMVFAISMFLFRNLNKHKLD